MLKSKTDFLAEIKNVFIQNIISDYGFCCFSEVEDDFLMWSHYADKHRGVCLIFDISNAPAFFYLPFKVDYPPEYPYFNYIRNRKEKNKSVLQFSLATKSEDWKYEKEIRIIKENGETSIARGPIQFRKNCVKEVIFGYRCSPIQKKTTIELFENLNYSVIFTEMQLKTYNFGLEKKILQSS